MIGSLRYRILFIFFLLFAGNTMGQITPATNWTWVKGDNRTPLFPVHGTRTVADAANTPGGREGAVSWKDASGNMWVYGGAGFGFDCNGWLNDLWKYNVATNEWTWLHGSRQERTVPVWGIKGTAAASNTPGSRLYATTWTDLSGNLWLFGGDVWGTASSTSGLFNDLWKYDISSNMWTWIKGDTIPGRPGLYGTMGVPDNANNPPARGTATPWRDANGDFWLYGGSVLDIDGGSGGYSDLWRYRPSTNQWTWMKGDNTAYQPGVYGVQGVPAPANNPGGRNQAMSAIDEDGNFWLFGGRWLNDNSSTYKNDLWKYDPLTNNWTWMRGSPGQNPPPVYGILGVPSTNNTPGGRTSAALWADTSGNLLLFAGNGISINYGVLNDMWKYNIATNQWTWIMGPQVRDQPGVYGTQGVPAATNIPGSRHKSVSITDAGGNLYFMGGEVSGYPVYNDVWRYNSLTNQWVWLKGDNKIRRDPVFGTQGVSHAANTPGETGLMVTWTDPAGNLWAFGGTAGGSYYNAIWKYNPLTNEWTWIKGSNVTNRYGVYGTQGVPAAANNPGSRYFASSWSDAAGNLWIFGGDAFLTSPNTGRTNELWKYNIATNQWVWLHGSNQPDVHGTYGTQGVPAPANTPGARYGSYTWTDNNGDFWLYGGSGFASNNFPSYMGLCADLWKYTVATNQWTFMGGANVVNTWPIYGTRGIEAATNKPGGRGGQATWTDASGNLWFFGGGGYTNSGTGALNDMWRYNMTTGNWTWMKGDNLPDVYGVYGTQGVPAATNKPGGHSGSMNFKDPDGNFWFFGGNGTLNEMFKGDLWKFDVATSLWTWVKGDPTHNQYGVYGTLGVEAPANKPGTRRNTTHWYVNGNLWIFAGDGSASDKKGPQEGSYWMLPYSSGLNDMWVLGSGPTPPDTVRLCDNGSGNIISNVTGTGYQWQQNTGSGFANISDNANFSGTTTATLQLTNIPASWNGYLYRCVVNGSLNSRVSKLFIIPVTGTAASTTTSCAGVNDGTITITATGGIAPFTFSLDGGAFQSSNIFNGVSAGAHTVVIRDFITCARSIAVNVASGPATATASVSIAPSTPTTICSGTSVTFTATPVNGGASPTYQWQVNGINAGTNSITFTTSTLNNNDQVKVIMTSSLACVTPVSPTSNIVTMLVTPAPIASAGPDVTICTGSSTQLQASGGTNYSWSPTAGLSDPNIANPIASPLTTMQYIVTVSNGSCISKDTMVLTVIAAATPTVNINPSANNICVGTTVLFSASATNGGSTPGYQWQVNGINVGTNSSTYSSSTLSNNDQVKVILTSSLGCVSPTTVTSNIVTMLVTPIPVADAGSDVSICSGASTQLQASGGTTYSWSPAAGLSNASIANPVASPLATTTYTVTVSNGSCSAQDMVVVTVNSSVAPTVNISTATSNTCSGTAVTFTANSTNGGPGPAYQWQVNGVNAGTNSNSFSSSSLNNNDQVKVILTSNAACVTTTTVTSNVITMNVSQLATPLLTVNNRVFTVTNPDLAALYTWQVRSNGVWFNVIPAATGVTYTAPAAGEYRVRAVKAACTLYSASETVTNVTSNSHFIYLHPNPSSRYITVDSINLFKRYETLEIADMQGRRVLPVVSVRNMASITIDISALSGGTYMVILRQMDGTFSALKFIKQ